jgi:hypothetical protein
MRLSTGIWILAIACLLVAVGIGIGIPAAHVFEWLRTGSSSKLQTTAEFFAVAGWSVPHTSWIGLQKLISGFFKLPFALTSALPFVIVGSFFSKWASELETGENRRRHEAEMARNSIRSTTEIVDLKSDTFGVWR